MGLDLSGLKRIKQVKEDLARAVFFACMEYGNGGFRAEPIVRQHFTDGNQGRYKWAPLSAKYAGWKKGNTKDLKKGIKAAGRVVPKGKSLPMLVLTGKLRDSISGKGARVNRTGPETFVISWLNRPNYAIYHHTGTAKMPKRSPIEPNEQDQKQFLDAANRYLSAFLGKAGTVAPGGAPGPRARA